MAGEINFLSLYFYSMKLFKFDQYKITVSEEAFALKPFK